MENPAGKKPPAEPRMAGPLCPLSRCWDGFTPLDGPGDPPVASWPVVACWALATDLGGCPPRGVAHKFGAMEMPGGVGTPCPIHMEKMNRSFAGNLSFGGNS